MQRALVRMLLCATWAALSLSPAGAQTRSIEVVSSPPDLVTTPGVLVRVQGADLHPVGWASNDTLITPFYQNEDGDWFGWIGLSALLNHTRRKIFPFLRDRRTPPADFAFGLIVPAPAQPLYDGPRPPPADC